MTPLGPPESIIARNPSQLPVSPFPRLQTHVHPQHRVARQPTDAAAALPLRRVDGARRGGTRGNPLVRSQRRGVGDSAGARAVRGRPRNRVAAAVLGRQRGADRLRARGVSRAASWGGLVRIAGALSGRQAVFLYRPTLRVKSLSTSFV